MNASVRVALPRIWPVWLRLAALSVLEFAWTAKVIVGLLALFNVALFYDPRTPLGVKIAMPLMTVALVLVRRRFIVAPKSEPVTTDGVDVGRDEAPSLWALVHRVRRSVRGGRVHRIVVGHSDELSLRLERRHRGLPRRRVLGVGFALLARCSPSELEALVALALAYGRPTERRFAGAFMRLGETYAYRLAAAEHWGFRTFLSRPFYRWLTPRVDGELARLSAARLLRADGVAAGVVSPEVMGRALVKHRIVGAFLEEEFWASVWSRAAHEPEPPADVYSAMTIALAELGGDPACWRWMTDGLDYGDATLRRRLEALGRRVDELDPQAMFEAGEPGIVTSDLAHLARRLGERWGTTVEEEWRVQRGENELALAELGQLDVVEQAGELDGESLTSYAALVERFRGPEEALELYERATAARPDDAVTHFHAGRLSLRAGDASGLDRLERAMALDSQAVVPACIIAERYLRAAGRPADAEAYAARSASHYERRVEAEWSSSILEKKNDLEPHDLDAPTLAAIRDRARQLQGVDALFLARKAKPGFPGEFRHVAMVLRRRPRFGLERGDADRRVATAVKESVPLPEDTVVYATTVDGDPVWLQFREVPGANLFRRNWRSGVKWPKVMFIAVVLAFLASMGVDAALHNPALNGTAFFSALGGVMFVLYRYETRRPATKINL